MDRLEELMAKQRQLIDGAADNAGDGEPPPEVGKNLVEQVQENLALVKGLEREISDGLARLNDENRHVEYDVYRPKIRLLEDERDSLMRENTSAYEKERDQKQNEITRLYVVVNEVKRILEYLKLKTLAQPDITDEEVEAYHERQKVNLGYIFNDEYLKIKLFIGEGGKPVNKFSLVALGRTLFPESLLKLRHDYGDPFKLSPPHFSLVAVLREAPTVEHLLTWMTKTTPEKLAGQLKGDYEEVKAAYIATVEHYEVEDFLELLTDRCTCGNFLSIFDSYARRDEIIKCWRCNQDMEKLSMVV